MIRFSNSGEDRNAVLLESSRPALRSTQLPIQWVSGLILRAKTNRCKVEIKNGWTDGSTPFMCLRGVDRYSLSKSVKNCKLI